MANRFPWSLLLLFLLLAAVIAVVGRAFLARQQREVRQASHTALTAIADLKAAQIAAWRNERLSDARFFSRAALVAQDVAMFLANPASPESRARTLDWLRLIQASQHYQVVALFDPRKFLYPLIQSWPTPSRSAETLLVRRDGDDVLFLNDLRQQTHTVLRLRHPVTEARLPAARAVRGELGLTEGLDYRGVPVAAARAVPDTPWFMIAKADEAELHAPLYREARTVGVIAAALLLAAALGVGLLWRHSRTVSLKLELASQRQRLALAERVALLLRQANDIILLLDDGWRVVEANDRALQTYGYSEAELRQTTLRDLGVSESQAEFDTRFHRADTSQGLIVEAVHRRKDGSTFPVETSVRSVEVKGQKYHQAIVRDITERKRAEEVLRESEDRYRSLVEESPDAIGIYQEGKLVFVNSTGARLLGAKTQAEVLGRKTEEMIHPEDFMAAVDRIKRRLAGETGVYPAEVRYVRLDGTTVLVEVGATPTIFGRKPAVQFIAHDITERKRAEEALRESEAELQCILGATADGILAIDHQGKVIKANPRFATMWRIPQPLLETGDDNALLQFVLDQLADPEAFLKKVQALYASKAEDMDTLPFKDGRTFERYSSPLMMAGSAIGRVWSFRDITERKRAEQALRESEVLYQSLVENLQQCVFRKDRDGRFTFANQQFCELVGRPLSGLIGQTDFDLFPRELAEKYRRDDQQVVASGQAFEAAESHRTPAGEERFVQVVKTPLRDATGQIVGVQGIFWDITERLRAGEALRESEENYRSIVETTAEWIWEMDLTGKHTFSNLGVTGILGYRPEELIGQSAISLLHAEDRPEVETTLLRLMAEKRGWRGWILRWRHQDGSYRYLESNANPILNAASELVGYRGADHDITERKRTEQALKESEELFRSLSASSPVGIFLADLQGHCVYANPRWRAILGLTLGESVGEGWLRAVHPDDREALTSQWSECVRQKREYSGEFRVRPPAGRERWVHMRSVIRHADSSEPTGLVGTLEDITERKRTEEALRESLRRFELLTGVAGDLLLTPDPQELVEGLCRRVMDHLDCHAFFNFLADEKAGRLHLNACAGISEEEARRIEWLDYGVAVCGCSARDGCRIVAENIETTPDPRTELVKSYGIRAYACHPLQGADGKVIGALSFGTRTRDTFSGDDLLLMKAVTDQVAVAMIRVKAHETLRESEEKYRGLFKSSRDAIMTLEPPSWRFTSGNPATVRMFGAKEDAELTSKQPWVWSPERQPDGRPSMDKAMEMIETAMREGSHFFEWTHRRTDGAEFQADVLLTRVEQRGKAILQATVRDITERKQAEEALRKSGEQLRALAERLQAVREEERIQLAREVHDQVGQALTSLNLDVAWLGERLARPGLAAAHRLLAGRLEAMSTLLAQTMGTVQRISSDLRPGMLDDLGLSAAIEWQAEEFATRTGLTCEAHCSPLSRDAGPKCSTAMFRILQELLTNVVRHAQARRVDVELREHAGALILEVRDDGRGIAEEQIHAAKSLGLLGIQERAQAVAGAVEIRGQPGRGTRVTVTVPLT